MHTPPEGRWIKVTILRSKGFPSPDVMPDILPEVPESDIVGQGKIYVQPDDSPFMLHARIHQMIEKLLPGYQGSFTFVFPINEFFREVFEGEEQQLDNYYVRLTKPFLGLPPPEVAHILPNGSRKRSRSESPEPPSVGGRGLPLRPGDLFGVPTRPGGGTLPSKKSRKDVWQIDSGDPMEVLQGLISKHLYGFVSAPGLKVTAKEIAMSSYFDWLDNVPPKHPGHVVIVGNPGVGKTTGAWALAKFLAESGIVKSEIVVEAHRDDLIDKYVGGTEMKTNYVINSAHGGVVIFDEIYALNKPSSPNDSGKEALTTIMKYMTRESAPVFMFLGYKKQMKDFVNMNPGFQRRVKYLIEMQDYNPKSLAMIAKVKMEEMQLTLDDDIDLEPYFHGLRPQYLQFRNATVAVILVNHALSHARKRTLGLPPDRRKGQARVLRREDWDAAVKIIKAESQRCSGRDDDYNIFI